MAGGDEYEIETTLCMIHTVHVFQIPPRSSSGGHRANDWTREVWDGKLKIVQKGSNATVYLLDKHNGNEFAQAPVVDGAVEKCVDSSRYFVLRCVNQKDKNQRAFIGLAFNERNDAFE
eukprot:CAMPEP_0205913622 /NCGR_PEP_ID=MMETSP1325-20131115/6666_1 /ASSEMBLY_ACC=CAM_ASM_000708 /TAXON_ID=236786 /ORGANISM="Florenciella sp., Strain RCC1007" /LENGTH=117 /DNA_ID=CAMNT_0053280521 /DNA_START=70 /DNA_END=420 /DNA_ORIENTATION=+